MRLAWIVILLFAAGAVGALAQEGTEPAAGSRVRLRVESSTQPLEGTLAGWTDTSLRVTLSDEGSTVAVPRAEIARLETMTRPSRRAKGVLIGSLVVAGAFGAFAYSMCGTHCDTGSVVGLVLVGAAGGGGLGAMVAGGAQWQDVPLAQVRPRNGPRLSLGLTPGGGVAARLSIAF